MAYNAHYQNSHVFYLAGQSRLSLNFSLAFLPPVGLSLQVAPLACFCLQLCTHAAPQAGRAGHRSPLRALYPPPACTLVQRLLRWTIVLHPRWGSVALTVACWRQVRHLVTSNSEAAAAERAAASGQARPDHMPLVDKAVLDVTING